MEYQKIVDEQAHAMGVASVQVAEQNGGSASTDLHTIYINPRFAEKIHASSGENGMRFVLAHELGHARGGARGGHEGEFAADRWAAQSVARTGVGYEAITGVMSHLNTEATASHPAAATRSNAALTAWTESASMRPPRLGVRHGINGEEIPRPLIKNMKPPREKYRSR